MSWVPVLGLIGLAVAVLWRLQVRGAMLQVAGAALLIGAAGYALHGRPGLPGSAARASGQAGSLSLAKARHAFFGEFSASERWLIISESYARRGRSADAVGALRSAVREHPRDPQLWIGLGNALVEHGQMMTPPAELAYARAAGLAPTHPAPPFFRGLALIRSGEREEGVALWRGILANAPADASWRPLVEDGLAAFGEGSPSPRP